MANLKSLAKDTAIYGLSSIVGRFLNYLLVPIYTTAMAAESGGYGVVTNVYAWVALVLVLLTCGMETTFFRFANKQEENPMRVYSTSLAFVGGASLLFLLLGFLFLRPIAGWMGYAEHPWYLGMMMIVVAMDAVQSIPFAYLRYQKRPLKFASLKLLFIALNIALNLIYFVVMKGSDPGAAFFFNLVCTSVIMLCFLPELRGFSYVCDRALLRRMLAYSLPLLVLGLAGILNQVADKIIFPFVYPDKAQGGVELGIYGAAVKIAMVMAMLTQAFRYAYEPFVFAGSKEKDSRKTYADAMKFFGANIAYFARSEKADATAKGYQYMPLKELMAWSDVIFCCLNKNTVLLHEEEISQLGQHKILFNTGLSPAWDEPALLHWLDSGDNRLYCDTVGALGGTHLMQHPKVRCMNVSTGRTQQAFIRLSEKVLANIRNFLG
jgi:hypothetical protein